MMLQAAAGARRQQLPLVSVLGCSTNAGANDEHFISLIIIPWPNFKKTLPLLFSLYPALSHLNENQQS
jgi:hypothetical protein